MSIIQFMQQEQVRPDQEQQTGMIWDYVSPSRLSLWLKCPLAFRKRYIDGEQTSPTPSLFVGKVNRIISCVYARPSGEKRTRLKHQYKAD